MSRTRHTIISQNYTGQNGKRDDKPPLLNKQLTYTKLQEKIFLHHWWSPTFIWKWKGCSRMPLEQQIDLLCTNYWVSKLSACVRWYLSTIVVHSNDTRQKVHTVLFFTYTVLHINMCRNSSQISTAVIFKIVVILCSFGKDTDISGEHAVYYIFKFLWNVGGHKKETTQ